MTREEAIQELQNCKGLIQQDGQDYLDERDIPIIDMAIEALLTEETLKTQLANCHKEILRLLDFNNITESPNDDIEPQNDVIKKPRTVRYKLHKPIEYVSIEVDEEETVTDIAHYNEVVRCKDCRHRYVAGATTQYYVCDFMDAQYEDDGYCHHGELAEQTDNKLPGYDEIMDRLDNLKLEFTIHGTERVKRMVGDDHE